MGGLKEACVPGDGGHTPERYRKACWELEYKTKPLSISFRHQLKHCSSSLPFLKPTHLRTNLLFFHSFTMAYSFMSRLAAVAIVLLSLGFLVQASPIAAPAAASGNEVATIEARHDKNCYGEYCYGGNDIVAILLQLQAAIELKLGLLDGCLGGGDYASIVLDIEGILYAAIGGIKGCKIGLLGLLTGKLLVIAKIWFSIVISIATHCGQWVGHAEFSVFLGLIAKLDLALKLCLFAIINLGGIFGGLLGICIGLFAKVHIALLTKVNFVLCLGALKLGGY
ncbi:hypothetical protein ACGC1H_007263 [Rhizoctonia solani]|uniref:Transmembrane protein n=1 Tax=Rhizoctonia solani TaxID=456999 RepID=A0A8H3GZE4_9AGAM|nr:unnamed protein product [Rhizoctonia solani]